MSKLYKKGGTFVVEIEYSGHLDNPLVEIALRILEPLAGVHRLEGIQPAPHQSFLIFPSHGQFPNRYIRLVKNTDEERRSIVVPNYGIYAAGHIALNQSQSNRILKMESGFRAALIELHFRLTATKTSTVQTRKKSKLEWSSGFHARLRRERQGSNS